jgi:hypothetical protein
LPLLKEIFALKTAEAVFSSTLFPQEKRSIENKIIVERLSIGIIPFPLLCPKKIAGGT